MNRREAQLTIESCITYRKTYQNQPYTCVHLEAEVWGKFYSANGFSIVRRWNTELGEQLATEKAVMEIVGKLSDPPPWEESNV